MARYASEIATHLSKPDHRNEASAESTSELHGYLIVSVLEFVFAERRTF